MLPCLPTPRTSEVGAGLSVLAFAGRPLPSFPDPVGQTLMQRALAPRPVRQLQSLSLIDPSSGGGGTVTFSGCRAYNSGNLTVHNNAVTPLALDSERFDTNAYHSLVTNTSRLTVSTAGYYLIAGSFEFTTAIFGQALIYLNGTTFISIQGAAADATVGSAQCSISTVYKLAGGDYVELAAYQNSGADATILAAGNYTPEFMIAFLGY